MLAIILPLLLALFSFWHFFWRRRGLPPGPTPVPLFGNTLALKKNPYEAFQRWTKEFGPIYTVWMGDEPTVMVTEYGLMRDLFIKEGDAYAGREFMTELIRTLTATKGQAGGVFRVDGEPWKVMRRFSLQTLRNLGMGRTALEKQFLADITEMIGKMCEGMAGGGDAQVVDILREIDLLIGSIINRVLFGYPFKGKQIGEFYQFKELSEQQLGHMASVPGIMMMTRPWLHKLPIFSKTFAKIDKIWSAIMEFMDQRIEQKIETRRGQPSGEEPKDLVDYFLDQMDKLEEANENENDGGGDDDAELKMKHFTRENLRILCADLFLAGQETTATTLNFLVLYLLLDQRVQTKMQAELDGLDAGENGRENCVTLADRPKLPYVNAVINEVQRMCNLLPINLSHRTMCDVEIMGGKFRLKKGTTITPQICCVLFDEKIFPDPQKFKPERFLDENGQLKKCEELIPFSLGKRICLGESMARTELFLFTTNFFRNFKVFPVDPLNPPSSVKLIKFAARVQPYKCRIVAREKGKNAAGVKGA